MKRSFNIVILIVLLTGIAGMFLWQSVPEWFVTMKAPVDFTEMPDEDIRAGVHVEGEVYALLGDFASEQTWTERGDGSVSPKTTSKVYFVLPVGNQSFIGVQVSSANRRAYSDISDATLAYLWGETEYIESVPAAFDGRLVKMDDALYQYLIEWFQDTEYFGTTDEAAIKTCVLPYLMVPKSPGLYTLLAIGGGVLLVDILAIVLALRRRSQRRAQQALAARMPAPVYTPQPDNADALRRLQQ